MSVLSDVQLKDLVHKGAIEGADGGQLAERGVISFGVSSYGFDARLGDTVYSVGKDNARDARGFGPPEYGMPDEIDPKAFAPDRHARILPVMTDTRLNGDSYVVIPPYGFALGHTVEYFKVPKDVLVICLGKSTYARCGLIVNVTPLEPEWEGQVTLELHNTTNLPMRVYINEGICQFIYLRGEEGCETTYKSRKGKYLKQKGVTFPKVRLLAEKFE